MNDDLIESDQDWADREMYWRYKLRRLQFHSEPLSEQVEKYRRVTVVLSGVVGGMALLFLLLFSAFGRPDIALLLDAILFAPMIGIAWFDVLKLSKNLKAYELERKKKMT